MAHIPANQAFRATLAVAIMEKLPLDWDEWNPLINQVRAVLLDDDSARFVKVRTVIRAHTEMVDDPVMQDALTGVLVLLCP